MAGGRPLQRVVSVCPCSGEVWRVRVRPTSATVGVWRCSMIPVSGEVWRVALRTPEWVRVRVARVGARCACVYCTISTL